jgi:hypothetical protein
MVDQIISFVLGFLNRKERCRVRAASRALRDLVEKPRPMKRLRTHHFAKIKMILNLGKTIGHVKIQEDEDGLKNAIVCYGDQEFSYRYMKTLRFSKTAVARMFFMAYKFREFDSKMFTPSECFQWQYQLTPERAEKLLAATPEQLESINFLVTA